ncbi:hypothetical protein L6164_000577 [Bauhinia variegata]|uniref:Uncharacterized protein n=1 Tax=Bauhinia variegata TaxID=167791 RepID=A0ACB9Q6D1_BAUVA|nr:hypothetical protein L6164_000577 [Bauhinia variegata]
MGKQSKARKPGNFAKGKVTPIQIAFIVDRYLCDNSFLETRSMFRNEASSLIANSPIHEAPKTLLSLGAMLDEYICLKEQKVILDQERARLEQEKYRVQMLFQGMQNVMNAYNTSANIPPPNIAAPPTNSAVALVPQPKISDKSPPGVPTPVQNTLNTHALPPSTNTNTETGNFSSPMINLSDRKRKDIKVVDAPSAAKKSRSRSSTRKLPSQGPNILPLPESAINNQVVAQPSSVIQSLPDRSIPSGSQVQGSTVAKCLFNQPSHSVPSDSPVPKTPPRANSSHSDSHVSPSEISSAANCSKINISRELTPTRCTVISTKRVMVSPAKQMAYIERSHCISPLKTDKDKVIKRDHVRSRLYFDGSDMPENLDKSNNKVSTSEPEKEVDIFGIDFPSFEALEMDFSFTEMLGDLDLHCEGIDFSCDLTSSPSNDDAPGSPHKCEPNQVISELSSTMTEALSEKDTNLQGSDCLTAVKSFTKCITILSPVKKP